LAEGYNELAFPCLAESLLHFGGISLCGYEADLPSTIEAVKVRYLLLQLLLWIGRRGT
jgi:hypothetical protein